MSWFKRSNPEKKVVKPSLSEGLAALEQCGIRKRDDISIEDILFSTGGTLDDPIDYVELLCVLGGDVERDDFRPISDDIWYFDTECICDDGDYVRIANRLLMLSKGALAITNLRDCIDIEGSVAWLEFDFGGKQIHFDFEVQDDWVDGSIFSRFVELLRNVESESRFTYADLGGQDCLIGFATEQQRNALTALTGLQFEWLT
jgi:hypothetical protein